MLDHCHDIQRIQLQQQLLEPAHMALIVEHYSTTEMCVGRKQVLSQPVAFEDMLPEWHREDYLALQSRQVKHNTQL